MHFTVRKYADKAALIGGLVPPIRDGFVPLLRRAPGFKGFCAFASEDGHVDSFTLFDDRQTAMRAEDWVREWVVSNLRDLLRTPPEVLAGEAPLHEVSQPRSGGPAMFATVRVWEGVGPREEVLPWVHEHVFLTITGAPGFRGYWAFLGERDASRACRRRCSTACAPVVLHEEFVDAGSGAVLDKMEKVADGSDRRNKAQGGGQMTPTERERVKAALRAYREQHHLSIHDLAARINAEGKKVDPKTLHRYLDRRLIVDDPVMEVYRTFVDRPG